MGVTYFKRYRMELSLPAAVDHGDDFPRCYEILPWDQDLIARHADTKYRSFRSEVDSVVFPCLGDSEGCLRLMEEISLKDGFLPAATWLLVYLGDGEFDYCGTIQGIRDRSGLGSVQNVGITPEHRGRGLGTKLIYQALRGFEHEGITRVYLEVTARNTNALRLYRRIGFRHARTSYKAVEAVYS